APACRTDSAVASSFSRCRATRTIAPKSFARRLAVERPIPWLAPVTIATDASMASTPGEIGLCLCEVVLNFRSHLGGMGFEREVTGIKERHTRMRGVA